ncbi:nucleotidyltransferase family protein [Veillonella parvula]|uniref:tRNA(Met) cytidine acetate ligase n=1 Tax=Veillonella parvula TaxID=29466 RepID=UPI00290C6CF1|nr:nucleotidyltransferase family protein [Veillonella parvula]MDU5166150.1 nucleotidyltransferase family protein [Veillonella parvula]MDU5557519.1 nucleotidyltransferase family protein [Veillonella parvula]MDU7279079.1 nucleotidyltransferase family protein [Veillonella parvula]
MKTIGIICEYNPFHNGHAHQLHTLAQEHPEALRICIMSGSFVQRGEPAIFSKFDRARWAILGGADIVIELPTLYSLGSAQLFGTGAIRMVKALHIDALSFGSETADLDTLVDIAKRMDCESTQAVLRTYINEGMSYGSAFRKALDTEILNTPNALLGLEYIRAGLNYHPTLKYMPILRISNHHEANITKDFPSGTALRKLITDMATGSNNCNINRIVPKTIADDMTNIISNGAYVNYNRYYDMVHTLSRRTSTKELESFGEFNEGIEHLWSKAAQQPTWNLAMKQIKSKRYTYARLQRMGAYLTLRIQKDLLQSAIQESPQYARLLAFNDRGRQWLRNDFEIPLIQKWAKAPNELNTLGQTMHQIDTLATDIQALCLHNEVKRMGHMDYTYTPQYIK